MPAMAKPVLKLTAIFSLVFLLSLQSQFRFSSSLEAADDQDVDQYIVDNPNADLGRRSKFLVTMVRKGAHCEPNKYSVCNGVYANNGTSLLQCCKTHCRNILGDRNNCGKCGLKCRLGELCCNGVCTSIAYNVEHCGKCNQKCAPGLSCDYGTCGYA